MDSLSRLDMTSSGKGKRLASWSNSEFRRSRWRLDGLDLAPSMGGGLTLEIKTFLQFSWIHLCLSLAYGSIIEASHPLFHFTFHNIDTHTHTHSTLSLFHSHTHRHTSHKKIADLCTCAFSNVWVTGVVCLFFLQVRQLVIHYTFLFCSVLLLHLTLVPVYHI